MILNFSSAYHHLLGVEKLQVCTHMPILYNARDRTQSLAHARQTLYQLIIPLAQIILYI